MNIWQIQAHPTLGYSIVASLTALAPMIWPLISFHARDVASARDVSITTGSLILTSTAISNVYDVTRDSQVVSTNSSGEPLIQVLTMSSAVCCMANSTVRLQGTEDSDCAWVNLVFSSVYRMGSFRDYFTWKSRGCPGMKPVELGVMKELLQKDFDTTTDEPASKKRPHPQSSVAESLEPLATRATNSREAPNPSLNVTVDRIEFRIIARTQALEEPAANELASLQDSATRSVKILATKTTNSREESDSSLHRPVSRVEPRAVVLGESIRAARGHQRSPLTNISPTFFGTVGD